VWNSTQLEIRFGDFPPAVVGIIQLHQGEGIETVRISSSANALDLALESNFVGRFKASGPSSRAAMALDKMLKASFLTYHFCNRVE
jgi:hypothetical protein